MYVAKNLPNPFSQYFGNCCATCGVTCLQSSEVGAYLEETCRKKRNNSAGDSFKSYWMRNDI